MVSLLCFLSTARRLAVLVSSNHDLLVPQLMLGVWQLLSPASLITVPTLVYGS